MSDEQPKWLERAKETYRFHREQLISHNRWNTTMTAKALRRSTGSVLEDLLIARWSKTHEAELEKIEFACDALVFIRKKQKDRDLDELD